MESPWRTVLWPQFAAAIDMLDDALAVCPDTLWRQRLWPDPPDELPEFAEFWYVGYHALFWLDLYLTGLPEEEFAPPAPFIWTEADAGWRPPERPYTKAELRGYLAATRQKAHTILAALTDERARRLVEYGWMDGHAISYAELQLYNMRHVQEHGAQLSLFLGQHGVHAEDGSLQRERIALVDSTTSKAQLLDDLDAEEAAWEALLDAIGEEHMTQPGVAGVWSIKDIVAHITAWRRRTVGRFQAALRHEPTPAPPWPANLQTDDEINAWFHAADRDRPLADILRESREVYEQLAAALAAFPEAELRDPARFAWLEGEPLTAALLFGHFHEEHESDMRAWLEKIKTEQR